MGRHPHQYIVSTCSSIPADILSPPAALVDRTDAVFISLLVPLDTLAGRLDLPTIILYRVSTSKVLVCFT